MPLAPAPPPHSLACMEVWGGNGPARTPVALPGHDAFVLCEPWNAAAAGGDIYYLSNCMAGLITRFMLADVAGHGQSSDALAGSLRRLMRKHINTADQSRLARALNREFAPLSSAGRFATALLATYFAPTDHLILCNAGHPAPLWFHADQRRWSLLTHDAPEAAAMQSPEDTGIPNLPLGILDPTDYHQFAVRLAPGDAVVLYTDALIEASGPDGRALGEAGLLDLCAALGSPDPAQPPSPEHLAASILEAVRARAATPVLDDDATIVALVHTAADPPAPSLSERFRTLGRLIGLH